MNVICKSLAKYLGSMCLITVCVQGYTEDTIVKSAVETDSIYVDKPIELQKESPPVNTEESLPSEQQNNEKLSEEDVINYLKNNPKELEYIFASMVRTADANNIKILLPIYEQSELRDPSLIEWATAILIREEDIDRSIQIFRKLNAQFPNVKTLRFQLATALINGGQFQAAKSELEKLRSVKDISEGDISVIDDLLSYINKRDEWSFGFSAAYVDDDNITNSPPEGTIYGNGWVAGERESGRGLDYYLSAEKKWHYDNKLFTHLDLSLSGTNYFDNMDYSDTVGQVGFGFGYLDSQKEIEILPYHAKQYYGLGSQGDGDLHEYRSTNGILATLRYNLDNQLQYIASGGYADNQFIDEYDSNDNVDINLGNTLVYNYSQNAYLYGGVDYYNRDAKLDYNDFDRKGIRLGLGKTWAKGFATRTSLGYGRREYQDYDFLGVKRQNDEYNASLDLWNRGFYIFTFTPRIGVSYRKVESNSKREELEKTDFKFRLTKSF